MEIKEKFNRVKGVLAGCACGDAMGMPTEMMSRKDIEELFPDGIHQFYGTTERDFFGRSMCAGEITDDTVNTVLIMQMLIHMEGKVDAKCYLDYLQNWMEQNPEKCRYVAGPSTLRALNAISKGVSIERAGIFGTTNGAAMKISPIGMISDYHCMDKLVDHVEQICMPTHNTGIAIAGASAVAACISYGIQGGSDLNELWKIAIQAAKAGEERGYSFPAASLPERIEAVKELVESRNKETVIERLQNFYGTGMETMETVPAVLAIIHLAKGDPWEASCISAEIGGDTDTLGAISAAICSSMSPSLPKDVIQTLEQINHLDLDLLTQEILPYTVG